MNFLKFKKILKKYKMVLISEEHLKDAELSLKAKGLLSYIMSLPEKWEIHISEIINHSKDNKHAVYSAMQELIEKGYIKKEQKNIDGRFKKFQYKLNKIPLTENQEAVFENLIKNAPLPENQDTVKRRINKELLPLPENQDTVNEEPLPENQDLVYKHISNKRTRKQNSLFAVISPTPPKRKISKRTREYITMGNILNQFIEDNISDENIIHLLKDYYRERKVKKLTPTALIIILKDFLKYGGSIKQQKIWLESAITGGYMSIIPSWEKKGQRKFENASGTTSLAFSDMTEEQKEEFDKELLRDDDGRYISF